MGYNLTCFPFLDNYRDIYSESNTSLIGYYESLLTAVNVFVLHYFSLIPMELLQ